MGIKNCPNSKKDLIDIAAKSGYFKAENDKVAVSLDTATTLNIQPKGTIFGAKVTVEPDGSVTPTLTFDTKKIRETGKFTPPKDVLNDALDQFFKDNNV